MMRNKPSVLFLCTGNSARSQMAEGLLRARAGEHFIVYSAGTAPKPIHPLAVQAMQEIGIDIGQQRSKDLAEYLGHVTVWHLIVVCSSAQQSCPTTWPGVMTRQFWDLEDPAAATGTEAERLQKFRQIRDEIDQRIRRWFDSL